MPTRVSTTVPSEQGGESDDIEVVTNDVAQNHNVGLDPQHLGEGGHPDGLPLGHFDLFHLERLRPAELAESCLDVPEPAKELAMPPPFGVFLDRTCGLQ